MSRSWLMNRSVPNGSHRVWELGRGDKGGLGGWVDHNRVQCHKRGFATRKMWTRTYRKWLMSVTSSKYVALSTGGYMSHIAILMLVDKFIHLSERWKQKLKKPWPLIAYSLLYNVTKYHYADCVHFCLPACLVECCRDICWCRRPCFSVLTSQREAKPNSVRGREIVSLNVMSHVHILHVAKPLYYI